MRKLLIILMSNIIIVPTVSGVVACMPQNNTDPTQIGVGIDKSKAIDDGIKNNTASKFTNYYIVGDSLSDVDGISNYLQTRADPLISTMLGDISIGGFTPKIKLNYDLDGKGYGFTDESNIHHNAFSNGPTAGYILGEKLGFANLQSSNYYNELSTNQKSYGKNYSIGGATAAHLSTTLGTIMNDVTIEKQTAALIQQHKIGTNDITFFEIGGNDVFAMIDNYTDPTEVNRLFTTGITAIRKGLFTLLNNGIKKVVFMTPPKMNFVPKYIDLFQNPTEENKTKREFIESIGEKFQNAILDTIKEVEQYYPNQILLYDLYDEFEKLLNWFKTTIPDAIIDRRGVNKEITRVLNGANDNLLNVTGDYHTGDYNKFGLLTFEEALNKVKGLMGTSSNQSRAFASRLEITINVQIVMLADITDNNRNIDQYFFVDQVHPTKAVHEYVANLLLDELTSK